MLQAAVINNFELTQLETTTQNDGLDLWDETNNCINQVKVVNRTAR